MKQNIIILAAALVAFAACSKEQAIEQPAAKGLEISATVEQQVDNSTKSSLNGTSVVWTAGDEIKVFDNAGKGAKLVAQTAATSTSFKEPATPVRDTDFNENNLSCAIYPYSDAVSCSGTTITFNLPATQDYAANSFGQGANVAVGTVSGTSIAFKNVCGVLKLQVKGNFPVEKIVLKTKGTEKLCGTFTVNAASAGSTGATWSADGTDSLTLNCVTTAYPDGVQLSAGTATTFNIVVPVGALTSGLVAKVYSTKDCFFFTEINTTKSNQIKRSLVKAMPACSILPPAYQKLASLTSTGTQYIYTGLTTSDYDTVEGATPVVSNDSVYLFKGNSETLGTVTFKKGGIIVHQFVPCYPKFTTKLDQSIVSSHGEIVAGMYDIYSTSNNLFDGVLFEGLMLNSNILKLCNYFDYYPQVPRIISSFFITRFGAVGCMCTVLKGHTYSWNNTITFTPGSGSSFRWEGAAATLYSNYKDTNNHLNYIGKVNSPFTATCNGVLIIGRYAHLQVEPYVPWTVNEGSDLIQINEGSTVTSYQRPAFFHNLGSINFTTGSESFN